MIIHEIETNAHEIAPLAFTKTDIDCVANSCAYTAITCDVDFAELLVLRGLLADEYVAIHTIYNSMGVFETEFFDMIGPIDDMCKEDLRKLINKVYTAGISHICPIVLGMYRAEVTFVFTEYNNHYILPNLERSYDKKVIGKIITKNMRDLVQKFSKAAYGASYNSIPIREKYEVSSDKQTTISTKAHTVLYGDTYGKPVRNFKKPQQPKILTMRCTIEDIIRWRDTDATVLLHYDTLPTIEKCIEGLDPDFSVTKFLNKIKDMIPEDGYELSMKCIPTPTKIDCVMRE